MGIQEDVLVQIRANPLSQPPSNPQLGSVPLITDLER